MADGSYLPIVTVRRGNRFDLGAIEILMQDAYEHQHWELPGYDPLHCWQHMLALVSAGNVAVAEQDGQLTGLIALAFDTWPWAPSCMIMKNVHFFVHSRRRRHGTALRLLKEAKQIVDDRKSRLLLQFTYGMDEDLQPTIARFMKMQGFTFVGGNYWYTSK